MLSVNQMNGQIKLTEAWKISNIPNYPIKWEMKQIDDEDRITRATSANIVPETARTTLAQNTFNNDAKKLWNKAPEDIKNAKSLSSAKKAIKKYVTTLPIQAQIQSDNPMSHKSAIKHWYPKDA